VLNSQGSGSDSAVIAAIQQAIALKSAYNIRVLNLSLAETYQNETVELFSLVRAFR
jgi:hypothetical protein